MEMRHAVESDEEGSDLDEEGGDENTRKEEGIAGKVKDYLIHMIPAFLPSHSVESIMPASSVTSGNPEEKRIEGISAYVPRVNILFFDFLKEVTHCIGDR